jgi:acetyl-CoA acetyltransferase family protein
VNPRFPDAFTITLGETAEKVADKYGVSRERQDEFALRSQQRAAEAMRCGRFNTELVSVDVPGKKGQTTRVELDEHPRSDTTLEQLARLTPAFRKGGTVTAGNSSGLNDGAAALLLADSRRAQALGWKPLARVVSTGAAGVEPDYMGMGPVPATQRALKLAQLSVDAVRLVELNEAFAAQAVACVQEPCIDPDIVNVNGGAIALGHPLGCSGARILTTLIHELGRRGGGYGLASMCIGVGQGITTIVEVFAHD